MLTQPGIAHNGHEDGPELPSQTDLPIFIIHNHKEPLVEPEPKGLCLLLHLVGNSVLVEFVDQLDYVRPVEVSSDDVYWLFESWGELNAGSLLVRWVQG